MCAVRTCFGFRVRVSGKCMAGVMLLRRRVTGMKAGSCHGPWGTVASCAKEKETIGCLYPGRHSGQQALWLRCIGDNTQEQFEDFQDRDFEDYERQQFKRGKCP